MLLLLSSVSSLVSGLMIIIIIIMVMMIMIIMIMIRMVLIILIIGLIRMIMMIIGAQCESELLQLLREHLLWAGHPHHRGLRRRKCIKYFKKFKLYKTIS